MAAKIGSAKGKRATKVPRGRLPVKRTINLVLLNENRISLAKAIPLILLIVLASVAFGKYLVYDRINDSMRAESRVNQLRSDLEEATELSRSFGEVESVYAHYTIEGMTSDELQQVDRVEVLKLVRKVLLSNAKLSTAEFNQRLTTTSDVMKTIQASTPGVFNLGSFIRSSISELASLNQGMSSEATTWNLSENILTINITGKSLETMNDVTKMLEQEPIVDTCVITTANKTDNERIEDRVSARFIIYLKQPEEVSAQ